MSWVGVITDAGVAALNRVLEEGITLNINAVQTGSGTVDQVNMRSATGMHTPVGTALLKQKQITEAGVEIRVEVQSISTAYILREVGIFGVIDGNTVMLALYQNEMGVEIPANTIFPDYRYILNAVWNVDNLDEMTITPDPGAFLGTFQGLDHAGQYLVVGQDGYVRPTTVPYAEGASF